MRDRFAPDGYEDPMAELVTLKQTGTVDQFHEDFLGILNLLDLSDSHALSIFMSNLKIDIA